MKNFTFPGTQTNRVLVLMVAVMLVLLVAMMIPQLAWADHDPAHFDEWIKAERARAMEAYTARWVAMGEWYANLAESQADFRPLLVSKAPLHPDVVHGLVPSPFTK